MRWILAFLLLFTFAWAEESLVRLDLSETNVSNWIIDNNLEIVYKSGSTADVIISSKQFKALQSEPFSYEIRSTEEQRLRDIAGYRSYSDLVSELNQIVNDHPDIVQLSSLGNSLCKDYYLAGNDNYQDFEHEVWCLKVSDNPEIEEDEPNIFYGSEIHAREPISLEVNMNLLNYLLDNYGVIDSVTAWVDQTQIWFIPLINPDGHKLVIDGTHTMHRKNMRDNNSNGIPDNSTLDGVDLNRNFGYVWGPNGTSTNYYSNIYNGPNEWSEQEVVYLKDLLQSHKFYAGITYHSYGQYVLYPLGHIPGCCSFDHEIMGDLATNMASTIARQSGSGNYTPSQAVGFGYTCQGTMGDWAYAEERIFGYTIELASSFIPPASAISQICDENLLAALILLDRVNQSTVSGHILDQNGDPTVAEVYVSEIDGQSGMSSVEPFTNDELFGRYDRLLLPGIYNISFRKPGYINQDFVVEVFEDSVTNLEVQFEISSFVSNELINIWNDDEYIYLSWDTEPTIQYQIVSSEFADRSFSPASGQFLSQGNWRQHLEEDKQFYKIKIIERTEE